MFDRNDFEELAKNKGSELKYLSSYPGLHFISYPENAFIVPESEESIRITIAPKAEGDNGLLFWIAAELLDEWRDREDYLFSYLSGAYFERINETEFNSLVAEKCKYLIKQPELPIVKDQAFVGALLMYSMRTDFLVSAIAEYKDSYIHFYWETTA